MTFFRMTWSARRINSLLERMSDPERYLEIGIWKGQTIGEVNIREKWGVDPNPLISVKEMTEGTRIIKEKSDCFFEGLSSDVRFDLIFLDGLHEARQTFRDLTNAMKHLSHQGVIVIDDVVPDDDWSAHPDQKTSLRLQYRHGKFDRRWQGDVWKILPVAMATFPGIEIVILGKSGSLRDNAQAVLVPSRSSPDQPDGESAEAVFDQLDNVPFSKYLDLNPELFLPITEDVFFDTDFAGVDSLVGDRGLPSCLERR